MRLPGARRRSYDVGGGGVAGIAVAVTAAPRGRASCSCRSGLPGHASTEGHVNLEGAKEGGHNRYFRGVELRRGPAPSQLLATRRARTTTGRRSSSASSSRRTASTSQTSPLRSSSSSAPRARWASPPARAHPCRRRGPLRGAAPRARARAGRVDGSRVAPRRGSAVALEGRRGSRRRERLLSIPLVTARLKGFDWSLVQPARTLDATAGAGIPSRDRAAARTPLLPTARSSRSRSRWTTSSCPTSRSEATARFHC